MLFMVLDCSGPTFRRTIEDPVMTPLDMESALGQLRQLNLTVGSDGFEPGLYPLFAGVDVRNGKTLIKKFICWDGCPELGKVYLVYQGVATEESLKQAVKRLTGVPLPLLPAQA